MKDFSPRVKRPDRFIVILDCPFCQFPSIVWNQHSTARKCKNIDCGETVRLRDVSEQILKKLVAQNKK